MRVNELARELEITSRELLEELRNNGVEVKNHAANLTVEQARLARQLYGAEDEAEPAPEVVAAPESPAAEPEAVAAPEASVAEPAEAAAEAAPETVAAPEPPAEEDAGAQTIELAGPVVVKDLAELLGMKPNLLIAELMKLSIFATITQKVDFKIAQKVGERHGFKVVPERKPPPPPPPPQELPPPKVKPPKAARAKPGAEEPPADRPDLLESRPPVVTFMGHVDHGKTSLLDYIRKSRVAAGEAGGITQHMGAYMVEVNDRHITFLDTPGHAAFTAMRARGANLTDIAVIVISADEGIKPQTREAIQHAQAAGVTVMVALNKIDLPHANVDRVKGQLQQEGLAPDDWGGTISCVPVSAITGAGMDDLLDMILLQADMLELKAAPRQRATGHVLESRLEPGQGPTATLLVQQGTLKVGDALVCGDHWGRVKAMINDRGIKIRTAGPSHAIKVLGLNAVPEAGAEFQVMANDREARAWSEQRSASRRMTTLQAPKRGLSLDDLLSATDAGQAQELPVVLKSDVQGTLEAIQQALQGIQSAKVTLRVVLAGVGNITVNDILLARASNAIVIGFHVSTEDEVNAVARREGVEIRLYSIIYELVDEVRAAMAGLLEPISREIPLGQALVKQVFEISKSGAVAGCIVRSGRITARARARVRRQNAVLHEGVLSSLKRFQNDAAEVREGQECGIRLEQFSGYHEGDVIEAYDIQKIAQEL
jgi:translation initiation factor IF-2